MKLWYTICGGWWVVELKSMKLPNQILLKAQYNLRPALDWVNHVVRTDGPVWFTVKGDFFSARFFFPFHIFWHNYVNNGSLFFKEPVFSVRCSLGLNLMLMCFCSLFKWSTITWQQRQITGPQRNTWPWWWGIAQCPGGPQRRQYVKRSTLPC